MAIDLGTKLGPIELHNPLMTASGTAGYGAELSRYVDVNTIGALVGKSISKEPRQGNPYQRTVETASGMLNAIGLQNEGWESFTRKTLPMMRELCGTKKTQIIVNIVGHDLEEYVWLAERVNDQPNVAGVELNLSCPNVSGGMKFSTTPEGCQELVAAVRDVLDLPLIAKLSPNVASVPEIAKAAEAGGADVLSLINTLVGVAIDWRTRKPVIANVTGGLSGPAIKPVALRCVWQAAQAVDLPIIGIGGIANADDVMEFLVAGASAVQLGTMLFVEPDLSHSILDDLRSKLREAGVSSISELVGTLQKP